MKNLMVYDWDFNNPYYSTLDQNKFKLHFFHSEMDILDAEDQNFEGAISHHSPKAFAFRFNEEIRNNDFPVICYREPGETFYSAKDFYDSLHLPKHNLHSVNTPEELSDLLEKIFK